MDNRGEESNPVRDRLREVAVRLQAFHGAREWASHGDPLDELIATILSQNTSDLNSGRAFAALKRAYPTHESARDAPVGTLAETIRSGGLAEIKAARIQAVLRALAASPAGFDLTWLGTMPVAAARAALTALPGVGPKTASCVLLFSFGMPALPVDTHVHRVAGRIGLIGSKATPEAATELLEDHLGGNRDQVYAFHLNMIAHGRTTCRAKWPLCGVCPLVDCCDFATNAHFSAVEARPASRRG